MILAVTNFNTILKYAYLYLDLSSKGGEAKENFKGFSEQKPSSFQQQVGFRERCAPAWQWDPSKGTPPHPPHPPLHRAAGTKPSLRTGGQKLFQTQKKKGGACQDNCIWALEITPEHHVLCIGTPHAFLNAQITTVKMLLLAAGW